MLSGWISTTRGALVRSRLSSATLFASSVISLSKAPRLPIALIFEGGDGGATPLGEGGLMPATASGRGTDAKSVVWAKRFLRVT